MTLPPVLILGMHRSGTSCLTGNLEEAGLYLGDVKRASPYNPKGNRENRAIMTLNEEVLNANDSAWDAPPKDDTPVRWNTAHCAARDDVLASYPDDKVWGFKDPRTLFTLDGWRAALPGARLVGSVRHPLAVARSLHARSKKMPIEGGLALWTAYNTRLLHLSRNGPVPLVCFDWPPERYLESMSRLTQGLGLPPPEGGFSFFDPQLRRATSDGDPLDAPLPGDMQALYDALVSQVQI